MSHGVVWFRNDLRLSDNPSWNAATADHDIVTALFVVDPPVWDGAPARRRVRLQAHLAELATRLRESGGRLRVVRGDPSNAVPTVAGDDPVYWNADVSPYAMRRDRAVAARVDSRVHHGRYVVPVGSIVNNAGEPYRVLSAFFRRWSDAERESWPIAGTAAVADVVGEPLPDRPPSTYEAGEKGAASRLAAFLEVVDGYELGRDVPASPATSRLSEDLKFGTISARAVESTIGSETDARRAFIRQLAWREFCAQLLLAHPDLASQELRPEYRRIRWRKNDAAVAAWKEGRTGYPIVDAGMRQLAETGWMHNRVRMLTASFLVKDLHVDWRVGERHFAWLLSDYDPAQNAANWQWVAGTGADAAPYFRVFNPVTQGRRFDPDGEYVHRWVPELAQLHGPAVHAPWEISPLDLLTAVITLGSDYPMPIVDHAEARREAIEMYDEVRA